MKKLILTILELLGVIESKQTAVKKRLGVVSQTKPQGPVTLMVHDIGHKRISALAAIRKVTGLQLEEAATFIEMLPFPLLQRVSVETVVNAQRRLQEMGITVELINMPAQKTASSNKSAAKTAKSTSAAVELPAGEYVVELINAGLLEYRVIEGMEQFAGLSRNRAQAIASSSPQTVVKDVDEETAQRIQRELQMMGAVVDIRKLDGDEVEGEDTAVSTPPIVLDQSELYDLHLLDAGPYRTPLMLALRDMTKMDADKTSALLESLPCLLLPHIDANTARFAQKTLEAVGAVIELVKAEPPQSFPVSPGHANVLLKEVGDRKISVIKTLRELLGGAGLREVKEMVDQAPHVIFTDVPAETAESIQSQLEAAGATIEIR